MGSPISQVSPSTQPQGKGFVSPNPQSAGTNDFAMQPNPQANEQFRQRQMGQSQGKGGQTTNPATSGQPKIGQPNMYPNTVGQWDNASIQPQQRQSIGGKGKG